MAEADRGLTPQNPSEVSIEGKTDDFFKQEQRLIEDVAGNLPISFKRGKGWAINPETGEATYDPKFFAEKGYTEAQSLFATLHEIRCHLVERGEVLDTPDGQQAYDARKQREKQKPWLHIWENCREDLKGNRAVLAVAPSLTEETEALYRTKLFPEDDLTKFSKHMQFIYAVLREGMLPESVTTVDPSVREALNKLKAVKGKDVLSIATDPEVPALSALRISERYIEPILELLYQEDKKDKKQGPNNQPGQGSGGEAFADEYADYENRHPDPFGDEDQDEKVKEAKSKQSAGGKQAAGYEAEHGVSQKDVTDYRSEFNQVDRQIQPLREVFEQIIEERKILVRRLTGLKEEGVMLDPGLIVQKYVDVRTGNQDSKTMKDFEGMFVDESIPGKFSLRLVADQSSSMTGTPARDQRSAAIVVMEALAEFTDELAKAQLPPELEIDIQSELRAFGARTGTNTAVYKELSKELTEKQRIEYFKALLDTPGGTNDYDSLGEIEADVKARIAKDPLYAYELKTGKRREIVVVFSDGGSGNPGAVKQKLESLRALGVKVVGVGISSGGAAIISTYAPDAKVCPNTADLPKLMQEMLKEYLGALSFTK